MPSEEEDDGDGNDVAASEEEADWDDEQEVDFAKEDEEEEEEDEDGDSEDEVGLDRFRFASLLEDEGTGAVPQACTDRKQEAKHLAFNFMRLEKCPSTSSWRLLNNRAVKPSAGIYTSEVSDRTDGEGALLVEYDFGWKGSCGTRMTKPKRRNRKPHRVAKTHGWIVVLCSDFDDPVSKGGRTIPTAGLLPGMSWFRV